MFGSVGDLKFQEKVRSSAKSKTGDWLTRAHLRLNCDSNIALAELIGECWIVNVV